MSIWEEQQKILNENLAEVKTRKYVNRHVLEAIKHREANMEPKYPKFVTTITVDSDIEYFGGTEEDAASHAHTWLLTQLQSRHGGVTFNFHTYAVDETASEEYGEEMYIYPPHCTSMDYDD